MSADKDRGIRRQKQKRAKQQKKLSRSAPTNTPVGTPAEAAGASSAPGAE